MASSTPIFRTVDLEDDLQLTLGEPISPEVRAHMQPAGPDRFQMDPGTFTGASSITATVASSGNVRSMDFTYGPDTSYAQLVSAYTDELGPPAEEGDAQTRWQDPSTRFTVSTQGARVQSQLEDLASAS